jgi:hypothetical protein
VAADGGCHVRKQLSTVDRVGPRIRIGDLEDTPLAALFATFSTSSLHETVQSAHTDTKACCRGFTFAFIVDEGKPGEARYLSARFRRFVASRKHSIATLLNQVPQRHGTPGRGVGRK